MPRQRLSKADWVQAALDALARGGVAAVRVDVLANRLDITRGSFYWHFPGRDALLTAALEEWERTITTGIIERLEKVTSPQERLRAILELAYFTPGSANRVEPALAADAGHPIVAPALRRVTVARLRFLTELYTDLGLDPATARHRALVSYAAFIGWLQLRRTMPDLVPETTYEGTQARPLLDDLERMLAIGART
jgi:AcrR family transcriptional regulator